MLRTFPRHGATHNTEQRMSVISADTTNQRFYTSLKSVRSDTQWHFTYRPQLLTVLH